MHISTPANTLSLNARIEDRQADGLHYIFAMQRSASQFYLDNAAAQPSEKHLEEVAGYFAGITGLAFSSEQAEAILSLYPRARIKVAVYDGIFDTDVRDELSFAVAHFFLGCSWPTYGDAIDLDEFMDLMTRQALAMGFKKSEPSEPS
jgi:hypothetical protein